MGVIGQSVTDNMGSIVIALCGNAETRSLDSNHRSFGSMHTWSWFFLKYQFPCRYTDSQAGTIRTKRGTVYGTVSTYLHLNKYLHILREFERLPFKSDGRVKKSKPVKSGPERINTGLFNSLDNSIMKDILYFLNVKERHTVGECTDVWVILFFAYLYIKCLLIH